MRSSLTIFLISLLITQNFCATTVTSKVQDIQLLENIRKTDFGRTVLQSLQLELKTASNSKDAVSHILELLVKLKQDETDAQAADDEAHATESGECEAFIAQVSDEIADDQETIINNNNAIQLLQTAVSNFQMQLDEANDNLVISTNSLQSLRDQREAGHSRYLQETSDISSAISALKKGREILKQLEEEEGDAEEGAFIQKKANVLSQFTAHMTASDLGKHKYAGFVSGLLTLLSREIVADQNLVELILHMIDNLIDLLSSNLSTLGYTEKTAQDSFDIQETNLESDIATLNSAVAELQSQITANNGQILDYQSDNANLDVTIANKSTELADKQLSCQDDENSYNAVKEQRTGEIDVIDQVINIFQTRFDNVREYLSDNSF